MTNLKRLRLRQCLSVADLSVVLAELRVEAHIQLVEGPGAKKCPHLAACQECFVVLSFAIGRFSSG